MKMNRLIPMLPVASMPASVEFYQKLGFSVEQQRVRAIEDRIMAGRYRLAAVIGGKPNPSLQKTSLF